MEVDPFEKIQIESIFLACASEWDVDKRSVVTPPRLITILVRYIQRHTIRRNAPLSMKILAQAILQVFNYIYFHHHIKSNTSLNNHDVYYSP